MKAVNCFRYGSSDVPKLIETEKPKPKDDDVLIKIHAMSINSHDWCIMQGNLFSIFLNEGLLSFKKNKILGSDIGGNGDGGFSKYV